jgi:uncharacterized protein (DUF2252 family)
VTRTSATSGCSPHRSARLTFDVNDFDETLPGPFEWDVKRLAASIAVAGRTAGCPTPWLATSSPTPIQAYSSTLHANSPNWTTLDIWNLQTDVDEQMPRLPDRAARKALAQVAERARSRTHLRTLSKLTTVIEGQRVIVDDPPLIMHLPYQDEIDAVRRFFDDYASTLQSERRHLLRQYRLVDLARKVVGSRQRGHPLLRRPRCRPSRPRPVCSCRSRRRRPRCWNPSSASRSTPTTANGWSPVSGSCKPPATSFSDGRAGRTAWSSSSASCAT